MTDSENVEEKTPVDKVAELREELRNARKQRREEQVRGNGADTVGENSNSTGDATGIIQYYTPTSDSTFQRTEHDVPRQNSRTVQPARTTHQSERKSDNGTGKLTQVDFRKRPELGRHGNNSQSNGSNRDDVQTGITTGERESVRSYGNLQTTADEFIPPGVFQIARERTNDTIPTGKEKPDETIGKKETYSNDGDRSFFKRKRGRPRKEKPAESTPDGSQYNGQKSQINTKGIALLTSKNQSKSTRLTEKEAIDLQEPLLSALGSEFEILDNALIGMTNDPLLQQPIWGDITEEELSSLVSVLLKLGKKSPTIASATRMAVDIEDYVVAGIVVLPRLKKTAEFINKARKIRAKKG